MTRPDRARIERALHEAEHGTTARVGVRFVDSERLDAFERAKEEFEHAGLHHRERRNAALILVAPRARSFAVIGDAGLHERVGDAFWTATVAAMQPYFAKGDVTTAVVTGLHALGDQFRKHFRA